MRRFQFAAIMVAALLTMPVTAQRTASSLPGATTLTGTEKIVGSQGPGCSAGTGSCATVNITPGQIATYTGSALDLITLQGPTASTGSVGVDLKRTGGTVNASIRSESEISNDYAKLRFSTRGADGLVERIRIDSGGYVGIGTATPQARLDVNGAAILRSRLNLAGAGTYASDSAAGSAGLVAGDVYKTASGTLMIKN